jgi:hypothetical protein
MAALSTQEARKALESKVTTLTTERDNQAKLVAQARTQLLQAKKASEADTKKAAELQAAVEASAKTIAELQAAVEAGAKGTAEVNDLTLALAAKEAELASKKAEVVALQDKVCVDARATLPDQPRTALTYLCGCVAGVVYCGNGVWGGGGLAMLLVRCLFFRV